MCFVNHSLFFVLFPLAIAFSSFFDFIYYFWLPPLVSSNFSVKESQYIVFLIAIIFVIISDGIHSLCKSNMLPAGLLDLPADN